MTKWKTHNPDTLLLMHAHNRMSRWNDALLAAADELAIPVCYREFPNHYDGSRDRVWLVPHGTLRSIRERAEPLHMARLKGDL